MRTASPMSAPPATAAGLSEVEQHDREVTHIALGNTGRVNQIHRVASREVYRNDWLTLREDDIRRPDGSPGIYARDRQAHVCAGDPA